MKLFLEEFAPGYTTSQLDAFNAEWEEVVENLKLEEYTEEYDFQAKAFCDEIARR